MTSPVNVAVQRDERLDEEVHRAVLAGGLRALVVPRRGFEKRFALLVVRYGAIDGELRLGGGPVRRVPDGAAHFLEHELFECEDGHVLDAFARHGAAANAYTSSTETAYHFTAAARFEACLDLLLGLVFDPHLTDPRVDKERAVIAQEIRMYDDDPDARSRRELLGALYQRHPVRGDVPGTVESIQGIDREVLALVHRAFYRPDNMLLAVAGDVDPEAVLRQADDALRARAGAAPAPEAVTLVPPDEPPGTRERRVELPLPVSMPRLLLGTKDEPPAPGPATLRRLVEVGLGLDVLFGRSGAFYERHYGTGLIDGTFSAGYDTARGGYAHCVLGGDTPDPDALVAAIDERLEAARRDGLDRDDFARIRNKAWGRFLKGWNGVEPVAAALAEAEQGGWDLFAYLDLLAGIRVEDAEAELARLFREPATRRSIVAVRPA